MAGTRDFYEDHSFNKLVNYFIEFPSSQNYEIIKTEIEKATSSEAPIMYKIMQNRRGTFGNTHFQQAEISHGAFVGGVSGGALGVSYQGLVQGIAPTTPVTGTFAVVGMGLGALYKFFSSEKLNSKNPKYPIFEKLKELELAAWKKENSFAKIAGGESKPEPENNTSGLRRRLGSK